MMTKKRLEQKVHRMRELERQISDLELELDNLKDEIKQEMTKRDVSELVGTDWKVSWSSYESSRFDQTSFKKDHPDLYESYKRTTPTRRFSVK